ncbi:MAG: hypothetical protein AAFV53_40885, partial [Myxococcota bacterium]
MSITIPPPVYVNGTNGHEFPTDEFAPVVTIDVTGGQLMVTGTLSNVARFMWGTPPRLQATCQLWINGAPSTLYTIDPQSGVITGPPTPVSPGDDVTIRFEAKATIVTPYDNQWVQRQDLSWTVPPGGGSITFDTATNPQQAPSWGAQIGFQLGGSLEITVTPSNADGSTQLLTITTQVAGGTLKNSTTASQSPPTPTTHTSLFDRAQASAGFEVWFSWSNNAGNRASFAALLFRNESLIGAADPFSQSKVAG